MSRISTQTKALTVDEELIAIGWLRFAFIAERELLLNALRIYRRIQYTACYGVCWYVHSIAMQVICSALCSYAMKRQHNLCCDVDGNMFYVLRRIYHILKEYIMYQRASYLVLYILRLRTIWEWETCITIVSFSVKKVYSATEN